MTKEIKYNKLVRDKIPGMIRNKRKIAYTHKADDKEYFEKLRRKYLEEIKEFFKDKSKAELADILEITYTLRDYLKIDSELLECFAKKDQYTDNKFLGKIKRFIDDPNLKKLGKILGMVYSACDELKISKEELESFRQIKAETKGKFLERIILEKVKE